MRPAQRAWLTFLLQKTESHSLDMVFPCIERYRPGGSTVKKVAASLRSLSIADNGFVIGVSSVASSRGGGGE
jgi:hypothetical protein